MSMFQSATQIAITGGTQIAAGAGSNVTINHGGQPGLSSAFQNLSAAAAHTALHNSAARFDAPRCHRNTRATYLDALERWMSGHGPEYARARLIWLTGGAGAGKSAIMQSIIERCAQNSVILGTFFFSRTDPSRNYAEILVPTLAYQLACQFPKAMAVLEDIVHRNPLIFKTSLDTQAHDLLVRPLLYLIETGVIDITSPLRGVFVIDGLDECNDAIKQALIIRAIADILCDNLVPIKFLLASRPEMAISQAFQREKRLHSIMVSITLDGNDEASSDIRQFIEDSFLDILDTHPLRMHIPSNWPASHSVDRLVTRSSGHFIYAATAMKFISSTDEHPARALQVVEGLVPSRMGNPFAELDSLYLHILTSAKYSTQVLEILRHCIFTRLDNSVRAICCTCPSISTEDIPLFLSDVGALVSLSPNHAAEMWVSLKHASLRDFFKDAERSHAIYLSREEYIASCLPCYFQLLGTGPQALASSLFVFFGGDLTLISELSDAITYSQDAELLWSLVSAHSPQDIWSFCVEYWPHHLLASSSRHARDIAIPSVSRYMRAIRDSVANHDNVLYIQQFRVYIQVLMDDLNKLIQTEPQTRIIPALMFSSSSRCLAFVAPQLIRRFPQLQISWAYSGYFSYLQIEGHAKGVIDPRSYEAVRHLPQRRFCWGLELAAALKSVLRRFVRYSWTPECLHPNPHERWLRRTKPMKFISQGSPKLPSTFHSCIRKLPSPQLSQSNELSTLGRRGYSRARARKIKDRRLTCFVFLKTVIYYLHKCDCTSELVKLARRSLPNAALWFPKLMKRARAKMDAYILRWEESPDGLLEKSRSLSINEMD